ncbi:MAG TPA: hypothetical protein VNR66_07065 [Solirubrobacteraceae bacterium]|nr:hypothetical protein [Solirubrobacteraceae bacterium]
MSDEKTKDGAPSDLITAVVNLVGTGPVPLGAYTPAEIAAVGGLIDWLERAPGPEPLAEAVRSLAARDLITTEAGDDDIEVRGDLGIGLAFQQRSRVVLDARLTGTEPDTPWRILLMPQPEQITLEVRIDALGIHFYSLRKTTESLRRLTEQLPRGDRGPGDADLDLVLAASPQTALVTVTHWQDDGARESTDLILASGEQRLHVFLRDANDAARFAAQATDGSEVRALIERLIAQGT